MAEAADVVLPRSPYKDFPAFFEYFNAIIFGTDTVLSFFRCGLRLHYGFINVSEDLS